MEETRQGFYDAYDEPEANADGELLEGNDPGGYNTFWMDEGTRLARVIIPSLHITGVCKRAA